MSWYCALKFGLCLLACLQSEVISLHCSFAFWDSEMLNSVLLQEAVIYLLGLKKVTMRATHKGDFTLKVLPHSAEWCRILALSDFIRDGWKNSYWKFCKKKLLCIATKGFCLWSECHTYNSAGTFHPICTWLSTTFYFSADTFFSDLRSQAQNTSDEAYQPLALKA